MTNSLRRPDQLYDGYIFDLDGTVYMGEALLPDAHACITSLRAAGRRTVFLSNNPTHSRFDYAAKLTRLGLPTPPEDIVNSSMVMADFLRRTMP
ncbi:MAG: HAD family hydrolase, partial [Anaerolineae bacterium]|nr:HAD family hydrolase [Anaerolineae bacterium]